LAIFASSSSMVAMCLLTIGSSTTDHRVLNLRWRDVDLENGILNLPDSKSGAKKVMLAAPALQILASLTRVGEFVIAGASGGKPRSDLKRPWERLTRHADLVGVRIHDLRHSFASVGAMSGLGLGVVGKLLGHASAETTARYSHFADDPVRRASERIAADIAASLEGGAAGNVIGLKKGSA
jgi:integrase